MTPGDAEEARVQSMRACPQGCTSSDRSAPVAPERPHMLTRWRVSAQRLGHVVWSEVWFMVVLLGLGLAVPALSYGCVELALASGRGEARLALPAASALPAAPADPNALPVDWPEPKQTQDLVLVRNLAAIEHRCPSNVQVYPALAYGGTYGPVPFDHVLVYLVYACGRRYVYRWSVDTWWDTTAKENR
jgi:hypothetical protein